MKWTFGYTGVGGSATSSKRFDTPEEAAQAAMEWMLTCARDLKFVAVQLMLVEDE